MVEKVKAVARALVARPVLLTVGVLVGLLVTGEVADWLRGATAGPRVVYRAAPGSVTREAAKWAKVRETLELELPELPPVEAERIAKKYGRDAVQGARTDEPAAQGEASAGAGAPGGAPGGTVPGSIARGSRLLGEWSFTSPDGECSIDVGAFRETDGRVTASGLWTNTPADDRRPLISSSDPRSLVGVPLRWRLTVLSALWPERDVQAAIAFRTLRLNRLELSPAAIAGYDFQHSDFRAGVGGVVTFDF